MTAPVPTTASRLTRLGFRTGGDAVEALATLGPVSQETVETLARAADPDLALAGLARIAEAMEDGALLELLEGDDLLLARLTAVLGASEALGEFLGLHPGFVHDLGRSELASTPRDQAGFDELFADVSDLDELRVTYRRRILHVAARDLTGMTHFEQSSAELADLAAATLGAAHRLACAQVAQSDLCRVAVIAMGKCGGRELNYVSDVDVVFVYEPVDGAPPQEAMRAATKVASTLMQICSAHTACGRIWEVDAALRPEGNDGPLVRTLASHVAYYERWAKTWEFQALMKARPVAGDLTLGQDYLDALMPMVWQASTRPNFVGDVRAMRRRVIEHLPVEHADRELKLGPGGLRDVEFAVQLLQMVHGRVDENLRVKGTIPGLQRLIDGGYVGRSDGAAMAEAYKFLRYLEHRIQLYSLRRTHRVPEGVEDLRRLGRSLDFRSEPADNLVREWQAHRREVRRLHQKLFYRPLLEAVAAIPEAGLRLTADEAQDRLVALGYLDPKGALSHLQALTAGVSRSASIQKSLLPAMLSWFAEAPNPDAGLLAFRRVSEGLGSSHWYLRKMRDEGAGAEQLAHVLSGSQYVTDLILRAPDSVAMFGDRAELEPRDQERLTAEMRAAGRRHADLAEAVRAVRRVRRRELARVGMADVLGRLDIVHVGRALSDIAVSTLSAALAAAIAAVESESGEPVPTRIAVVTLGRLGGHEAGYGSDADVMFVHDPLPGGDEKAAAKAASTVAQELRRVLALSGPDPAMSVDADLRPEGRSGPLVRTLASYRAYYARWSLVWEAQALLRAEAVVGDPQLCADFTALINPLRWPDDGVGKDDILEIRRIKARVDSERLPRGANPATHLKLGRGGLADVEWTVQLLQMHHAHAVEGLRTTETISALRAAVGADLLSADDAEALETAWRLVSRIRNAVVLMRSRPADSLVEDVRERAGVAYLLGYPAEESERMVDDYRRVTRRARGVVERVFWG